MADSKTKKDRIGPAKYLAQVRQEARKVVWPTWRETVTTTIMVMIMVVIMGAFFFIVDGAINALLQLVWKLGGTQ